MERIVDSVSDSYQEMIVVISNVLEAKEVFGAQKTEAMDSALEALKQRWEVFRAACDQAEEFVEHTRHRIGLECVVDEATAKAGQTAASALPPISALRLEQMSKAVRCLAMELQHGAVPAAQSPHAHSSFDVGFSEDAPQ